MHANILIHILRFDGTYILHEDSGRGNTYREPKRALYTKMKEKVGPLVPPDISLP